MREASLFGTNLVLRRTIKAQFGNSTITINDEIENESNMEDVPLMIMYHCNMGFPLLGEKSTLDIDPIETRSRDDVSERGIADFKRFDKPTVGAIEEVFYHQLKDDNHCCKATMKNSENGLGITVSFDNRELPYLIHWKCVDAGNYVTGIEPSNCHPEGVLNEEKNGTLRKLSAHEKVSTCIQFSLFEE